MHMTYRTAVRISIKTFFDVCSSICVSKRCSHKNAKGANKHYDFVINHLEVIMLA